MMKSYAPFFLVKVEVTVLVAPKILGVSDVFVIELKTTDYNDILRVFAQQVDCLFFGY